MPPQISPLYGDAGVGVSRFGVAGDLRRMYPVGAAGGLFSVEQLGQLRQSGSAYSYFTGAGVTSLSVTNVFGTRNMISNGTALYSMGNPAPLSGVIANRLGVTGTTGGNSVTIRPDAHGGVVAREFYNANITPQPLFWGGEMIYQNGNASAGTPVIGAAVEPFTVNVGGTVTVAAGSGSVTGNVTTFTTATLVSATYAGYIASTPSLPLLMTGDLILITHDAGTRSLHRVESVNAATGAAALTVSPVVPLAATARAYTLYRSGYGLLGMGNSRVISIENPGTGDVYMYYAGNVDPVSGGSIQCVKKPGAGGNFVHFMGPKTTSGGANVADTRATDIAYYKGFLLYGAGAAISWSEAGFPGGYTTGFGSTVFPSANTTVVDLTDVFRGFEYLGDQLIAIFENGIWEVQATGTVPEFQFFKLPEPIGTSFKEFGGSNPPRRRPFCSARNSVFYWSKAGVMQLSGGTATNISMDIWSALQLHFNQDQAPNLVWEPVTDSVFVLDDATTGFCYNVPTGTWSHVDVPAITGDTYHAFTGDAIPILSTMTAAMYDSILERIMWYDSTIGGPWYPASTRDVGIACIWATPIINLGDEYDGFPMAGFQLDGILGENTGTWTLYAGQTPYNMTPVLSGTVTANDNRKLLGKKVDFPFVAIVFTFSAILASTTGVTIYGVNIYPEGRGK